MMSTNPGKIVLKSSTKLTLNNRFTNIMKTLKTRPSTMSSIRAQVATDRLASERNRRLAQQMERRPSVAAELMTAPVRVSVRERLGRIPSRGNFVRGHRPMRGGRFQTRGRITTRGGQRPGRGGMRGRTTSGRRWFSPRGIRGRGRRGYTRGGITRGTYTRGRGRGRGGRQQRGAMARRPAPNKDTLDQQLDGYMTRAKSAMDSDLDSYMADIND